MLRSAICCPIYLNDQLIINLSQMKKEEKSTPTTNKPRSLYRYELRATNQILKDTMDICQSSLHSTAHTNRHNYTPLQELDDYLFDDHYFPKHPTSNHKSTYPQKQKRQHPSPQFCRSNLQKKPFQEFQLQKNYFHKQLHPKTKHQKIKKEEQFDRQPFISSQIYSFSSQNQNYPSKKGINRYQGSMQTSLRNNAFCENRIQPRRQRRGLANISLKVKNIVAKMGKMTFKQVSEQVLRESQQYLPTETIARQKQMKNIRRRVYDALNVLVSVGILGKYERCVVQTEFTNVPGKKLSEHWDLITEKNRILQEQQINYNNKVNNLNMLKKHYQMVLLFHERNKQFNQSSQKKQQYTRNQDKQHVICSSEQIRFYFPLVLIVPPKIQINNIKVNIQYDEKYPQSIKKFIIEDIEDVFTDLNLLKYLNLHQHLKSECLGKVKKETEMKQQQQQMRRAAEYQKIQYFHRDPKLQHYDDIYLQD